MRRDKYENSNIESTNLNHEEEINKPHSKQEAPMPEREGASDFQE